MREIRLNLTIGIDCEEGRESDWAYLRKQAIASLEDMITSLQDCRCVIGSRSLGDNAGPYQVFSAPNGR